MEDNIMVGGTPSPDASTTRSPANLSPGEPAPQKPKRTRATLACQRCKHRKQKVRGLARPPTPFLHYTHTTNLSVTEESLHVGRAFVSRHNATMSSRRLISRRRQRSILPPSRSVLPSWRRLWHTRATPARATTTGVAHRASLPGVIPYSTPSGTYP